MNEKILTLKLQLERMFAAPFVAQLGKGHVDGVYALAKDPTSLERFASASGDGVVKVWDLVSREEIWQTTAHENVVKSIAWKDTKLVSCAADRTIQIWDPYNTQSGAQPSASIMVWNSPLTFPRRTECL